MVESGCMTSIAVIVMAVIAVVAVCVTGKKTN